MLSFKSHIEIMIGMQRIRERALKSGKVIYDDGDSMVIIPYCEMNSSYPKQMMEKKKYNVL